MVLILGEQVQDGLQTVCSGAELGIEDADEILAVELMDLTGPMPDDAVSHLLFVLVSSSHGVLSIGGHSRTRTPKAKEELGG